MRLFKLFVFLLVLAQSQVALAFGDGFTFDVSCTPEQEIVVRRRMATADAPMRAAYEALGKWSSSVPPDGETPVSAREKEAITFWLGDIPDGDPRHPGPELDAWQRRVRIAGDILHCAQTFVSWKPAHVYCPPADSVACSPPEGYAEIAAAHAMTLVDQKFVGSPLPDHAPTMFLCPAFFADGETADWDNGVMTIVHEATHTCGAVDVATNMRCDMGSYDPNCSIETELEMELYGTDTCRMATRQGAKGIERNASHLQYITWDLFARQMGGLGSQKMVLDEAIDAGCSVSGSRSTPCGGICAFLLIAFAAMVLRGRNELRSLQRLLKGIQ